MKAIKEISVLVIASLLSTAPMSANALAADQYKILSDKIVVQYLNKASAIIFAPSLSRGSLFQLRGAYGSASFSRKTSDGTWCDAAPIRLLFGDFEGMAVDISSTGPTLLMIMNSGVADKLTNGQDIVGDEVTRLDMDMASSVGLAGIDILVTGSASAQSGFVLNPGRNFLDDLFGASSKDNSCGHLDAKAALEKKI